MTEKRPVVVDLQHISKRFVLRKDKAFKDRLLHPLQSKKHVDDFWALKEMSLTLEAGSTIGLIGANGSGKSTLLKVIGGIIASDTGSVQTRGRLASLIELGAGFHPDLTGRENVFLNASILGMSREETEKHFDDIVEFSGIGQFIDTQVKFYSSGMYVRLGFAVAVFVEPDILLVDEVLAVGDEAFQQKCLEKISEFQAQGRTIVIVSHAMSQIASLCERVIVLSHGQVLFDGDTAEGIDVLRSGFSEASEEEEGDGGETPERQNRGVLTAPARIISVKSTVPDSKALHPGETLTVDVEFEVREPTDKWDLTVGVVNPFGTTVMTTTARTMGIADVPIEGTQLVTVDFPNLYLTPGRYTIVTSYYDADNNQIGRTAGVGVFRINSGAETTGLVYSPAHGILEGCPAPGSSR